MGEIGSICCDEGVAPETQRNRLSFHLSKLGTQKSPSASACLAVKVTFPHKLSPSD